MKLVFGHYLEIIIYWGDRNLVGGNENLVMGMSNFLVIERTPADKNKRT